MINQKNWHPTIVKFTTIGLLFGLSFPLIGIIVDLIYNQFSFSGANLTALFLNNPLHWIVSTAPIILGVSFYFIGRQRATLEQYLQTVEDTNHSLQAQLEKQAEIEQALAERAKQLEATNQELDQFAYIVSHDLKAPLRGIENISEWITEEIEDLDADLPELLEYTALMKQRIKRMQNMIVGILEYSRAGRKIESVREISITPLVQELSELIAAPPSFSFVIQPDMPTILVEPVKIEQIFTNLLSNAVKYHDRDDGKIHIDSYADEQFYYFTVTDDGPGIEPAYHEKIFEIFQTLQSRDTIESTGIGLSIIKKIINDYGGDITVESKLTTGSKFSFSWPKQLDWSSANQSGV